MITVRTMGGLGNQMFQYAFGLAQAIRLGTMLQIDRSLNRIESSRPFNLDLFNIQTGLSTYHNSIVDGCDGRLVRERTFAYDPANPVIMNGDTVVGYWQNERYFEHIAGTLRNHFTPRNKPTQDMADFLTKIGKAGRNSVFLTVRRGDYVRNPKTQAYHGNMTFDYYIEALEIIKHKIHHLPVLFVFSDDIDWVKQNWSFGYETHYWDKADLTVANHIGREDIDLALMSVCHSAVIPNSSFAWWGAWLGDFGREGTVVAPSNWFADSKAAAEIDIVPKRWVKL